MFDAALFYGGNELVSLRNYRRRTGVPISQLSGGVIIFPNLGTPLQFHAIDQVMIFYPTGHSTIHQALAISLPNETNIFHHPGGKDLRIRFCSYGQKATATEHNPEDIEAMRQFLSSFAAELSDDTVQG